MNKFNTYTIVLAAALVSSLAVAQGPSKSSKRFEGQTMPQAQKPTAPSASQQPAASPVYQPVAPAKQKPPMVKQRPAAASGNAGSYWQRVHFGATARVGTLGLGLEISTPIIQDRLNFRFGFNSFSYNYEADSDDDGSGDAGELEYDGDLELSSLPLLLDFHPFKGSFRTTAGIVFNNNEINANARCNQASCEFGDEEFDAATIGVSQLSVDLGGTHPYLGIGWGNAVDSVGRWSFAFDLGVVFQDVKIDINPSQQCRGNADCNAEVEQEEADLRDDAEDFDLYPVLSFGISFKFK